MAVAEVLPTAKAPARQRSDSCEADSSGDGQGDRHPVVRPSGRRRNGRSCGVGRRGDRTRCGNLPHVTTAEVGEVAGASVGVVRALVCANCVDTSLHGIEPDGAGTAASNAVCFRGVIAIHCDFNDLAGLNGLAGDGRSKAPGLAERGRGWGPERFAGELHGDRWRTGATTGDSGAVVNVPEQAADQQGSEQHPSTHEARIGSTPKCRSVSGLRRQPVEVATLRLTTGDRAIDDALAELIGLSAGRLAPCDLGFFLHGSTFAGSRSRRSDVDVLVLGNDLVGDEQSAEARDIATEVTSRSGVELDLKLFAAAEFVQDPWVNIWTGAVILFGRDWRSELQEPGVDALAREAVLHATLIARSVDRRDEVAQTSKVLGWLVTALLASRHGRVPPTRNAAWEALQELEPEWSSMLDRQSLDPELVAVLLSEVLGALEADLERATPVPGHRSHGVYRSYLASR